MTISIGKTNLATTNGPNNVNKYQGRVAFPPLAEGGVNWINLNTNRSVGWHTFKVEIFAATVNFYVDGVLDTAGVPRAGVDDPFSVVRIGSGAGLRNQIAYYDDFRVLTPEPGDINLDGTVNRLDAGLFARQFGITSGSIWTTGDFDGDHATTLADLALLQANLRQDDGQFASASAVPEPSTIMLAACGLAAVALRRVRRRDVR